MTEAPRLYLGSGAAMSELPDGVADLVMTSPPYYPDDLLPALKQPRAGQTDFASVQARALEFARSFLPVYREGARVLRPGGAFIVQVRDLRYGGFLIPLVETHRQLIAEAGLGLVTKVGWCQTFGNFRRRPAYLRRHNVGAFVADDPEEFLVFAGPSGIDQRPEEVELATSPTELVVPLWRFSSPHRKGDHPWATPREASRRLLSLFSRPSDLVVDPMMGFGTILEVAHRLGRATAGWELQETSYLAACARLAP